MSEERPESETDRSSYDLVALGDAVTRARRATGLTVTDLAERSGVPEPVLRRVEQGDSDCNLAILHSIAHALGIGFRQLISSGDRSAREHDSGGA